MPLDTQAAALQSELSLEDAVNASGLHRLEDANRLSPSHSIGSRFENAIAESRNLQPWGAREW